MKQNLQKDDESPKKIVERNGRIGDKYAWLDETMVDWGDGEPKKTYLPGMADGVFIIAFLENGKIPLVHQYRLRGGWRYELPGGMIDEMDSEESAALRELEEETGYRAQELEKIFAFRPNPGLQCDIFLYVARKTTKTAQRLDVGEKGLSVVEVTPTQLWAMVLDGTITDAQTVLAVLLAKERGYLKIDKAELKKGHPF